MHEPASIHCGHARITNDVDSGHVFGILAANTTVGRKFARAEGRDECRGTVDATVAICGIASDELVGIPPPGQAIARYKVEQRKFVVYVYSY